MLFKQFLENDFLDDMFNAPYPERKILSGPKSEPTIIKCYRGFKANLSELERSGENYVLSPKKGQEGIIWFTHELQSNWLVNDPKEYAMSHARGGYLLTYPLKCTIHYYLEEGPYGPRKECPEEIDRKRKTTGKSQIGRFGGACYELPDGWFFTWQIEKHIGCEKKIQISPKMLTLLS